MRIVIIFSILLMVNCVKAQNSSVSKVVYKVGLSGKSKVNKNDVKINVDLNAISEAMTDLEYVLYFNNSHSVYELIDHGNYSDMKYRMAIAATGGSSVYYTDRKKNTLHKTKDYSGQLIHVESNISEIKWEITKETKMIGDYLCVKATAHTEYYSKSREKTIMFDPVVWFTNEIPVTYGPKNFIGLPGLVIEARTLNGRLYFYASEITTESDVEEKELQVPTKGKIMTQEEHRTFLAKYGR